MALLSCQSPTQQSQQQKGNIQGDVIIFHAGSLAVPFQTIARAFEQEYPGTKIYLESAGSVACARKITDLGKPCDIMASSDYQVIEELLIPEFTRWHLPFVSNEMVLAYNEKSTAREEINPGNWPEILSRPDVFYGRSDPDSDPCGYRTVMVMQLASSHYGIPGLEDHLTTKDKKYIRPKEVDLLALLEIGEVDYIFIYKSVAVQHNLGYVELPGEISLADPALNNVYGNAQTRIAGKSPGETISLRGEAMVYAVTILDKAPNYPAAEAFLEFLCREEKGLEIMRKNGQDPVIPLPNKFFEEIPSSLKQFSHPLERNH